MIQPTFQSLSSWHVVAKDVDELGQLSLDLHILCLDSFLLGDDSLEVAIWLCRLQFPNLVVQPVYLLFGPLPNCPLRLAIIGPLPFELLRREVGDSPGRITTHAFPLVRASAIVAVAVCFLEIVGDGRV